MLITLLLVASVFALAWVYFRARKPAEVAPVRPPKAEAVGNDFKWNEKEPMNFRPFVGKKSFKPSLAVHNISDDWNELFLIEKTYLDCTNLRRKYAEVYPKNVMHAHPNARTTEAVREFYEFTIRFLCERYPQYFKVEKEKNVVHNLINNDSIPWDCSQEEPVDLLRVLAGNIEEDFLIMLKDDPTNEDEEYIMRSSLTGSPAGFDPAHNFDRPISFIHKPVPQYKERLSSPMSRFFNKLEPKDLWVRGNFSVQTNSVLFKLEDHHAREGDEVKELTAADLDFDNCFMRCERQVLTRLPKSRANIMIVKTFLTPLKQIKAEGLGHELARAIDSWPDDLAFYKRRHAWGNAVTEYLRS